MTGMISTCCSAPPRLRWLRCCSSQPRSGEFSHARAQRRQAHFHEPGRFPFQHASAHLPHCYRAVPHGAVARARHRAGRRRRIGYTTVVLVGLARASISDIADRFGYGIFPMASYVAMLAAGGLVMARGTLAADILAAAALLLLAVNIRNAWDLMLAFARQVAGKSSDT